MRIAMIGSRGLGSSYGGIERVLDEICPRLADLGHSVDVFGGTYGQVDERNGVRAIGIPSFGGKHLENISRSAAALARAIWKYDIIHFHAIGPGILSLLTKRLRQNCVVTIHGLDYQRDKWGTFARHCLAAAERVVVGNADRISVVAEGLRRYFVERYDIATDFIPNGKPREQKVPAGLLLRDHGLAERRYILFASRLTPEKGCHDLIEAFNRLDDTRDMRLVIAGGTAAPEYLESLRAQATDERIVFVGHRTGVELAELYSNAYAFILPSYIEGMSMALLEAIGYGLPTLVSNIPENRAVVGESGFYFAPHDIDDLHHRLAQLITHPDLAGSIAQRLAARAHPDWDGVASQYDRLYRAVIDARRSR
jgi:glycosyltransferase involved in cell wall biosynthesis